MANKAKSFSIVANVAFAIPKFLSGAFNKFHKDKGRLTFASGVGRITPAGVAFFTAREGSTPNEKTFKDFAENAKAIKYPLAEKQGVNWPVGNNGIAWTPGQGSIGQSAFFYALCELTNAAAQADKVKQAKPATAKPATAKPATAKPATAKPATAKPATAKPATAKPATVSTSN